MNSENFEKFILEKNWREIPLREEIISILHPDNSELFSEIYAKNEDVKSETISKIYSIIMEKFRGKKQKVLLLYFLCGYKTFEIKKKLKLEISTVDKYIREGKKILKNALKFKLKNLAIDTGTVMIKTYPLIEECDLKKISKKIYKKGFKITGINIIYEKIPYLVISYLKE